MYLCKIKTRNSDIYFIMKIKTLLIFYILLITTQTWAQFNFPPSNARSNAMGGCYTSLNDYWSCIENIAGAASIKDISIGINYRNDYISPRQAYKSASFIMPFKNAGSTIIHYTHYGNYIYNEQKLSTGYAMNISQSINIGITIDYLHSGTSDSHYQNLNYLTCSVGIQFHPSNQLTLGAKIFNPIFIKTTTNANEHIPIIFNLGISYFILTDLLSSFEIEKNIYTPFICRFGLEYSITKNIFARIGFSTHTNIFGCGLGIKQHHYAIDISTQFHPVLGITPQISANYNF